MEFQSLFPQTHFETLFTELCTPMSALDHRWCVENRPSLSNSEAARQQWLKREREKSGELRVIAATHW